MSSCAGSGGGNKNTAAEEKEVLYCVCGVSGPLALLLLQLLCFSGSSFDNSKILIVNGSCRGVWCCENIVEKGKGMIIDYTMI